MSRPQWVIEPASTPGYWRVHCERNYLLTTRGKPKSWPLRAAELECLERNASPGLMRRGVYGFHQPALGNPLLPPWLILKFKRGKRLDRAMGFAALSYDLYSDRQGAAVWIRIKRKQFIERHENAMLAVHTKGIPREDAWGYIESLLWA